MRKINQWCRGCLSRWSLLLLGLLVLGCNRTHYRQQADEQVYALVDEKYTDPRWQIVDYSIDIDPRSRYFDPYDIDEPPMPPDDPASHTYMHCVNGMKGWKKWHDFGDRYELENPSWRDSLAEIAPINEQGEVILNIDSALALAYVHSPTYQSQLETLYLSALDVSTERFRLETQFFGSVDQEYLTRGDKVGPFEINRYSLDSSLTVRRRFATAADLLVGFANSFVWEFTGGDANFTSSLLNFSLVQPLLRGAGRDIALEQLTIVERGLLANVRAYTRYRQGFYTSIAIGELGVAGPSRRGGFFGGTGLTGFTGTGAGGLGGVGATTGFGRGGFGGGTGGAGGAGAGLAAGGAGAVNGFIGLLQSLQEIRNTQDSLALQIRTLNLLEAYLDAGVIDLVQVDEFRQSIETERALLLQSTNDITNSLENFKTGTLGLPPDLPVTLDDSLIQRFQLIDPVATELQNEISSLQDRVGELPEDADLAAITALFEPASGQVESGASLLDRISVDLDQMEDTSATREQVMNEKETAEYRRDKEQLHTSLQDLRETFSEMSPRLTALHDSLSEDNREDSISELVIWINDLYRLVQVSNLIQARARLEAVVVEPTTLRAEDAFQIALENRLDVMNNRAALVDSWRLIAFNADALQANLDVVFSGNMGTTRNNPFSFDGSAGELRAGLQFDAPFTRLLERNNFRQSLIDYQSDRRQFIQSLDGINLTVGQQLRLQRELELNLEIQRKAVVISIRRVDLTREELNEPVPPPAPGEPAAQFGPTAARNLLGALSDLRTTQNNFMSVWLNHYANRMRMQREMGIMTVDDEGRWMDEPIPSVMPYYEPDEGEPLPPPPVPVEFYEIVRLTDSQADVVEVSGSEPVAPLPAHSR